MTLRQSARKAHRLISVKYYKLCPPRSVARQSVLAESLAFCKRAYKTAFYTHELPHSEPALTSEIGKSLQKALFDTASNRAFEPLEPCQNASDLTG